MHSVVRRLDISDGCMLDLLLFTTLEAIEAPAPNPKPCTAESPS